MLGLTEAASKASVEDGRCAMAASVNAERIARLIIIRRIATAFYGAPILADPRARPSGCHPGLEHETSVRKRVTRMA